MLDTDAVALRAELEQERALTTALLERLVRCDDAACAAAATDQTGSHLIGCRIEIYWAKEKAWFAGEVVSFDRATGKVTVAYDDGDRTSHRALSMSFAGSFSSASHASSPVRACSPVTSMI
jgi:hypothetical protein